MQEEYRYLPHTCSCSVNPWNPKTTYQDITKCIKGIFQPWFSDISYNVQILLENKTEKCQMSNIWKGILRPSPSVCWRMHKLKLERSCIKHIFPLEAGKTNNDQMSNMLKNRRRIRSPYEYLLKDIDYQLQWKFLFIASLLVENGGSTYLSQSLFSTII